MRCERLRINRDQARILMYPGASGKLPPIDHNDFWRRLQSAMRDKDAAAKFNQRFAGALKSGPGDNNPLTCTMIIQTRAAPAVANKPTSDADAPHTVTWNKTRVAKGPSKY